MRGKVALVTGAASGIGRAAAARLAGAGFGVVASAASPAARVPARGAGLASAPAGHPLEMR
ncbi:MAG: SDR family NAD(P)-dependent oxidoreductase, partial [Solirubrobacteraceae bacterium]